MVLKGKYREVGNLAKECSVSKTFLSRFFYRSLLIVHVSVTFSLLSFYCSLLKALMKRICPYGRRDMTD